MEAAEADPSSAAAAAAASSAAAPSVPVLRRIAHSLQLGSKNKKKKNKNAVVGDCATFCRARQFLHLRVVRHSKTRELRIVAPDLLHAFEMRNPGYEWKKK
jgi:hypothetical protein